MPPPLPTVEDLVAKLQAREQAAKTVTLRMRSRTIVPDGPVFETEGTLRVLGKTHFHVAMRMNAGDGMAGEHEVVRTPNATWTHEMDPLYGEVFTQMSKETMVALEEASRTLGVDAPAGAMPGQSEAPLGSAMLVSLARMFDLQVASKLVRDGLDHWVVRGDVRARPESGVPAAAEEDGVPQPDRVEVLVRELSGAPFAVVRMSQYKAGQELMALEIDDVQIDQPMSEASFKLDTRGKRVVDVMEHPPAAAQIQAMLDKAQRKRAEDARPRQSGEGADVKKDAKRDDEKSATGK